MIPPAKGTLLIANPFLKDPNFTRTVIFLCDHKPEGSFGFVINKTFPTNLNQLIADLTSDEIITYYGGPVQRDSIQFLHQYPDLIPGGEEVFENTFWGGNFESLIINIKNHNVDLNKIKFFIGYSGWSEGQLDNELKENTWLTVQATEKLLFEVEPADIWKASLKELGGDYEMMINFPLDPQLN